MKASQLLRNPKVSLALRERRSKIAEKADVKSEEIIQELKGMALSNITDVISWDEKGCVRVKASDQLESYVKSAIKKIKSKTRHYYYSDGEPSYDEHEIEIEMHGKEGPLKQLGEYLGLWTADKGNTVIINQFLAKVQDKYGIIEAK